MFLRRFTPMLFTVLSLAFLAACAQTPQGSNIVSTATVQPQESEVVATSTIQSADIVAIPTLTDEAETSINETEVIDSNGFGSDPCESLGDKYEHSEQLGEIKEEYIGSWHAAPSVGSGYRERFVLFSSGNYLFFPSQYECNFGDESCVPFPIEEGTWGIQDGQMNLAKEGEIANIRGIGIGEVTVSPPDESPYSIKTTFDGTTYWLISNETKLWNPETGELCD